MAAAERPGEEAFQPGAVGTAGVGGGDGVEDQGGEEGLELQAGGASLPFRTLFLDFSSIGHGCSLPPIIHLVVGNSESTRTE